LQRIRRFAAEYPRQFWLLYAGMLISSAGGSMVWPFITLYARQRLEIPMTAVGLLLSVYAAGGLVTSLFAGPIIDRLGRKGVMVFSLLANSAAYLALSMADNLVLFALLMAANGACNPLYRVGAEAMVADLIPPDRRSGAYALVRMSYNVGVAIGPAVGGFLASASYTWAFYGAAAAFAVYGVLVLTSVVETLPARTAGASERADEGGYGRLVRDRPFLAFWGITVLAIIPSSLMFVLLPVYAKEQFGLPESQYGFVVTANALMVVLFQYPLTRAAARYRPLPVMATGALFYALGVGSVALGTRFLSFLLSMVIMTVGEMLLVPIGTTVAANLSPVDMRGRYMGFYGLTWQVGVGIGPVLGGLLSEQIAPVAIWYGGLAAGLAAALGYLFLAWRFRSRAHAIAV
jgi:MFS family permease